MLADQLFEEAIERADTIIHFGAGKCKELTQYSSSGDKKIVLVEADPAKARALQKQTEQEEDITVLACAVSPQTGNRPLHIYSVSAQSSLHEAKALLDYYPGLREHKLVTVETRSPVDIWKQYSGLEPENTFVIIDTPGEEHAIVETLLEADKLLTSHNLALYCGPEDLYEGSKPAKTTTDLLQQYGFEVTKKTDPDGAGRRALLLHRNPWMLENKGLRDELKAATQQNKTLQSEQDKLRNENNQLKVISKKQQAELEQKKQATEARHDELKALQNENENLGAKLAKYENESRSLREQCGKLENDIAKLHAVNTEQSGRLEKYEAEHAELMRRQRLLDDEVLRAEAQIGLIRDTMLIDSEV